MVYWFTPQKDLFIFSLFVRYAVIPLNCTYTVFCLGDGGQDGGPGDQGDAGPGPGHQSYAPP